MLSLLILQSLGWLLYAGPMIAFAILVQLHPTSIESFQKWGVGFGLSLAVWIYTSIAIQYIAHSTFYPDLTSNPWIIVAIGMWISNIKLEIWTMDPIRKKNDISSDSLIIAQKKLKTHLALHAIFVMAVHILHTPHPL